MTQLKIKSNTKENIFDLISFIIERLIHGLVISTIFYIITRTIDIMFGYSWRNYYIFAILLVILISIYPLFKKFSKSSFTYIIGWFLGIFILYNFNLIDNSHMTIYLLVPSSMYIIRLLFNIIFIKK